MSLPILSTKPYLPALHPITPTIAPSSRTEGSLSARKRPLEAISEVPDYTWTAPFRDGLPTPPNDMNSVTACSALPASSYGGKLDGFQLPPYSKVSDYTRMPSDVSNGAVSSSQPQYQAPAKNAMTSERESQKKSSSNGVASYLQIPPSISNSQGSLAEFAAQMTCLFWFESTAKLKAVEDRLKPATSLAPEAVPAVAFQKWVTNILSTTQVSQNVILLALLFVYRLKKFNPGVRGKKGSEYRLMTIALMLGNKFLDDNTYTNKTWAEVSGITVQEIHIMEVEFLSNIRYNLFVSKEEWNEWHAKLGLFSNYFNNAPRAIEKNEKHPTPPVLNVSPTLVPSPRAHSPSPSTKLPSPPASDPLRTQPWALPMNTLPYTGAPQLPSDLPPATSSRKRSREEPLEEPTAKRTAMPNNILTSMPSLPPSSALTSIPALPPVLASSSVPPHLPAMSEPVSRLPRPNFPSHSLPPTMPTSLSQLPPSGRVMPPVYNPSANWVPQMPPATSVPTTAVAPLANGLYNTSISLPDPSRHHNSPFTVTSGTISPAVSAYSVHTPQNHLSPSFFLANRNSPYRPVRSVNTLLIPPPSASLQQRSNIPFEHMHYQPLGKNERRTGVLPYAQSEAWPQGPFPQPIFHATLNY
ncbi:hypothetical protein CBS63078_3655 [Aspergillus niger]|uniref:putative mucin n=1 Tax=Aspergillus lacticoffeatus (strain CBS 101883) TaxID=1450533 RepID=UPI000D7F34CC|nr:uncharacterized protein BO96DRAFT_231064 [Aspergillus niger CBS 101883]KAI2897081.1 hypothetical protein CBS11852_4115 [Aspergillus niger]KAI2913914.1 hypothetical protein CBS63078_3655 [Aspergillus niger]KAI2971814.1 hypothetical protein CBS147323_2644 [Aspergillus niger]KAI3024777.1 hypothetical protein CBS147347_6105 [Aspergillus niger]KAI3056608.1 hypothetical protein CBS147343_10454 [Aspergillus niger]